MRIRIGILCITASAFLFSLQTTAFSQTNSWTNVASGNWEDPYWSLGVLPGTNQDILLTNDGVKVVTIGPNTAENFPDTMKVHSITVSSPPDSGNILLLNYAGFQTPLTARQLYIGSNCTMLVFSSSLQVRSNWIWIDGTFIQDAGSQVSCDNPVGIDGRYDLLSGVLNSPVQAINHFGIFTQSGGTNSSSITLNTQLFSLADEAPEYDLSGGEFDGAIGIRDDGTFNQSGGYANATNGIQIDGTFILSAGILNGPIQMPANMEEIPASGTFLQTGGTNFGGLNLGSNGAGNCVLSNGCSYLGNLNIGPQGVFQQFGGTLIITNSLSSWGEYINNDPTWSTGIYQLNGGMVSAGAMALSSGYNQYGGTNTIAGEITVSTFSHGVELSLHDGLLAASNLVSESEGIHQSGGIMVITNQLTIYGDGTMAYFGPDLNVTGGELIVSNIWLDGGFFGFAGGTLTQSGTLTLAGSVLLPGSGSFQFGPLAVQPYPSPKSSSIILPLNVGCIARFQDSSRLTWAEDLLIPNWSGSLHGGGLQQIIFGSNSATLTPQQVSRIQFQNPAGLAPGTYPARILATGEIVPMPPLKLQITSSSSNSAISLQVQGNIGQNYAIEVSTDLMNWTWWTNQSNSTGTISITDCGATNFPQRFYRVRLVP
ncbi:MAG TPA: hypothetical protein VKV04_08530 [Verrucomicrobiae bacterium]|nr:hypothetical protein [Verrucomicrobiae bacterium]